jgi:hypothetical protein
LRFSGVFPILPKHNGSGAFLFIQGNFLDYFSFVLYSPVTTSSAAPQIPVSEDAGIEPRTVATSALAVRRPNHSAGSHPQFG